MKSLCRCFLIIHVTFCICNSSFGQDNTTFGIYNTTIPLNLSNEKSEGATTVSTATSPCDGFNVFWGINFATGDVKEFEINAGIVTYTGNTISNCPGGSVAICNNMNGGATSPTIYTNYFDTVYYWNGGSSWLRAGMGFQTVMNAAGNGNNLYFHYTPGTFIQLIKYDGVSFSVFFTLNKTSGIADITVDADGNIWIATSASAASSTTDSIYVISPSAQILRQYACVIDNSNAYGCFLMSGVLYIGLGASNPVNPNSLIPVSFSGSNAIIGTTIPMPLPLLTLADLASCSPGSPLGINYVSGNQQFSMSPNPAKENLVITTSAALTATYAVYDIQGNLTIPLTSIINGRAAVNVSHLKNGIYIMEIKNPKGVVRKKFAKM